ncbi:speckle-type POZ protein-like [Planococcus citri]|uniref:speckle-type POZ protein-like n=1 Tax=Planococcus citri TaxID=170843 RepID=UPI0031F8DCA7
MSQSTSSSQPSALNSETGASIKNERCLVDVKWGEFSYIWTIKHFEHFHCKMNEVLKSTVFKIPTYPEYEWYLRLELKNVKPDKSDYFAVYLCLEKGLTESMLVGAKFYFLDGKGKEENVHQYCEIFKPGTKESTWGYASFISKTALLKPNPGQEILHEDTLTVVCELKIATSNSTTIETVQRCSAKPTISESDVLKSLERLLLNQDLIDVTFSLNDKKFGAHKIILAARSSVFAAMFKHDMEENQLNIVDIPDMKPEVFKAFLQYLYTDKTPDPGMARELLVAAEKYDVNSLKLLCEEMLLEDLSEENATDVLVFADLHLAEHLKKQVIFCIKTHFARITSTQSWKNTILAHPHLFDEVNGVNRPSVLPNLPVPSSSIDETSIKRRRTGPIRTFAKKKI